MAPSMKQLQNKCTPSTEQLQNRWAPNTKQLQKKWAPSTKLLQNTCIRPSTKQLQNKRASSTVWNSCRINGSVYEAVATKPLIVPPVSVHLSLFMISTYSYMKPVLEVLNAVPIIVPPVSVYLPLFWCPPIPTWNLFWRSSTLCLLLFLL